MRIALAEQWQVEEPFAGIIDDVDAERARSGAPAGLPLEFDGQPQLGNAPRRFRPVPVGCRERGEVILVGKAWHRIVRLRLEASGGEPLLCDQPEDGQGVAAPLRRHFRGARQLMDERGDEHRLAGAREAGHP